MTALAQAQEATNHVGSLWFWLIFVLLAVTVMALDLGVIYRRAQRLGTRDALLMVCLCVSAAIAFNIIILLDAGVEKAAHFTAGYLVEYSLSVDNIFVFMMIFAYFSVPVAYQHRVLFWGILGAAAMRMVFIFLAFGLVDLFGWILYLFAAFLIVTGVKFLVSKEIEVHPEKNLVLKLMRKWLRVTPDFRGPRFLLRVDGRLFATPLLLVLVVVEATDVVFAVDSVPAIRAITDDKFIAYTSNIFAIMGLRSMYFVLAGFMGKFHYLKVGLSLVLIFIGVKMGLQHWLDVKPEDPSQRIWSLVSLVVVVLLLGGSVLLSIYFPPRRKPTDQGRDEPQE
jgi:tellurite resistance protein TerC